MRILKRYHVTIELSPDDVALLANRDSVLVLADGRPLPIMVKPDGSIRRWAGSQTYEPSHHRAEHLRGMRSVSPAAREAVH